MFRYITKEKLTDSEKIMIFDQIQFVLIKTVLKEFIEYLEKHPKKLKLKRIPTGKGKEYQKVIEVPIPKLEIEFFTEDELQDG